MCIPQQLTLGVTYINHSIRCDSEKSGSLCNLSNLFPHVPSDTNPLQF